MTPDVDRLPSSTDCSNSPGTRLDPAGHTRNARTLPNLLVVGAAKAGTTSMHHYLHQHPEVSMTALKELMFFVDPDCHNRLDEYSRHFDTSAQVRGESSPQYTFYPYRDGVAERIYTFLPDVKLIYLVRDPLDRVVAHWAEFYADEIEHRSMTDALSDFDNPSNRYVCPSKYASQLDEYLRYFPLERILVIDQYDLRHNRDEAMRRAFTFLDVEPDVSIDLHEELNTAETKVRLTPLGARVWYRVIAPTLRRLPANALQRIGEPISDRLSRPVEEARFG